MKKYLFAVIFSFSGLVAFTQHAQMDQQSFEEMVKTLEKPSRSSWQKPEVLMDLIRPLKNKKVMDLGCGTGYFTFLMVDSGATISAADIDDRFLAYVDSVRDARGISKKQVQTRKLPPDNPMLDKREVDIVLIVNTYHHLQDRVNYLKKIKAGLKSTGYVVIIDYFKKDLPIGPPTDEKLSADDITRELKMAGFSQFKTEDKSLPYQYIVFAL
jgi:SAM-dependent methyltransferase